MKGYLSSAAFLMSLESFWGLAQTKVPHSQPLFMQSFDSGCVTVILCRGGHWRCWLPQ